MKPNFRHLDKFRIQFGSLSNNPNDGRAGAFLIPRDDLQFAVIAHDGEISEGLGWEHVSVHVIDRKSKSERCPTWEEMCFIKNLFWSNDECVVQYHPAKTSYINEHPFTLHLWKQSVMKFPLPPLDLV